MMGVNDFAHLCEEEDIFISGIIYKNSRNNILPYTPS